MQEWIALGIVLFVALVIGRKAFRSVLAEPIAAWLLKRGHVKWAMRVKPRRGDCCN